MRKLLHSTINMPFFPFLAGENISHVLQSAAEEWNLQGKIVSMTTDNARNIVLAVAKMGWTSLPCFGHTLQIAVRAGLQLPAVSQLSGRCRNLVGHFRHSYNAQNVLERKQEQLQLPKHNILQEVSTHWNSTLQMYKRLLEQQAAVSAVLLESGSRDTRELLLTPAELTQLEHLVSVLEPLGEATEYLASERWPSLSVVQPLLTAICKKTLQATDGDPTVVLDFKSAVLSSIKAHFRDEKQQQFSQLASVLDPRYKALKFLPSAKRSWCIVS